MSFVHCTVKQFIQVIEVSPPTVQGDDEFSLSSSTFEPSFNSSRLSVEPNNHCCHCGRSFAKPTETDGGQQRQDPKKTARRRDRSLFTRGYLGGCDGDGISHMLRLIYLENCPNFLDIVLVSP